MNVPLTPHPEKFPPTVEATILLYLSLNLINVDAIKDLIALKNNGTSIGHLKLSLRIEHLQTILNSRTSPLSKQAIGKDLERLTNRETLNYIADLDKECVERLRKASLGVASVSIRLSKLTSVAPV